MLSRTVKGGAVLWCMFGVADGMQCLGVVCRGRPSQGGEIPYYRVVDVLVYLFTCLLLPLECDLTFLASLVVLILFFVPLIQIVF